MSPSKLPGWAAFVLCLITTRVCVIVLGLLSDRGGERRHIPRWKRCTERALLFRERLSFFCRRELDWRKGAQCPVVIGVELYTVVRPIDIYEVDIVVVLVD